MRLHDLKPAPGATTDKKRLGRGNASGQGTTAGKGTKGQRARAGGAKVGFRGMSSRNARVAKRRGFTSRFKVEYLPINLDRLTGFDSGSTIDTAALAAAGLLGRGSLGVKILGTGEVTFPLHVVGLKVSASARQKIESAGGSVSDETPAIAQE
ncbi:MAG: 50S ribosomal protein L15 [Chloroflexota bacterium]